MRHPKYQMYRGKNSMVVTEGWEREEWGAIVEGYKASAWEDEQLLGMDVVMMIVYA